MVRIYWKFFLMTKRLKEVEGILFEPGCYGWSRFRSSVNPQSDLSAGKKLWSQSFLAVEKAGLWHLDITTTALQLVFFLFLDITHMAIRWIRHLQRHVSLGAVEVNDLILGQTTPPFSKPSQPLHSWQTSVQVRFCALLVSVFSHLGGTNQALYLF